MNRHPTAIASTSPDARLRSMGGDTRRATVQWVTSSPTNAGETEHAELRRHQEVFAVGMTGVDASGALHPLRVRDREAAGPDPGDVGAPESSASVLA